MISNTPRDGRFAPRDGGFAHIYILYHIFYKENICIYIIKHSMRIWPQINFKGCPPLVMKVWTCIIRVEDLPMLTLSSGQSHDLLRLVVRLVVAIYNWSCGRSYVSMNNRTINRRSQRQIARLSTTRTCDWSFSIQYNRTCVRLPLKTIAAHDCILRS